MSLTVRELIEQLESIPEDQRDLEVRFTYNYDDYWKTTVAATVDNAEIGYVKHSEYHRMDAVVDIDKEKQKLQEAIEETNDEELEIDIDPAIKEVVLLS